MNIVSKLKDLTGQKFNMLFVESRAPSHIKPSGQVATMWNCICDCGNKAIVSTSELTSGGTKSCGCLKRKGYPRLAPIKPGDLYGFLTAKYPVNKDANGKKIRTSWLFECVCGKEVVRRVDAVRNQPYASCGCMRGAALKHAYDLGKRQTALKDLTGLRFNRLLVENRVWPEGKDLRHAWWQCLCDCGNRVNVESGKLLNGTTGSCGCLAREKASELRLIDLTGQRFGKWFVESRGEDYICQKNGIHCPRWNCVCDCGTKRLVFGFVLRNNSSRSCGCDRESRGEQEIRQILNMFDCSFESQYKFSDLVSSKGSSLLFDFAMFDKENLKCLIEFQGEQHYETDPSKSFGYAQRTYTDQRKRDYCEQHGIPLYEIKYDEDVDSKIITILKNENLI